jgi:hypothetical protein
MGILARNHAYYTCLGGVVNIHYQMSLRAHFCRKNFRHHPAVLGRLQKHESQDKYKFAAQGLHLLVFVGSLVVSVIWQ